MARRNDSVTTILKYTAIFGGSYIFYSAGKNGRFGSDVQNMMNGIHDALTPILGGAWNLGGTQPSLSGTTPSPTSTPKTYPGRVYPQDNGDGTFSVVQEYPTGSYKILYGPTTKSAMEAWYTQNIGTYRG